MVLRLGLLGTLLNHCWSGMGKEKVRMQMAKALPYHQDGDGNWRQSVPELPVGN